MRRPEVVERRREYDREYRQLPYVKDISRMNTNARRDRRKKGDIPNDALPAIMAFFDNKCIACSSTDRLELDHIMPFAKDGAHDFDNVQILCKPHNMEKMVKTTDYRNGKVMTIEDYLKFKEKQC